jgi:Amt family ammonium transporter
MKKVFVWLAGGDGNPRMQSRRMVKRSVALWLTLVALGWFWLLPGYSAAQDRKPEESRSSAQAPASAPPPAESAKPRGDPSGTSTGDAGFAQDAGGTLFIPPDPGEPPDPKKFSDPKQYQEARKSWDQRKKAFDEFPELARKEPLALRLANAVGHNRSGINMTWILFTGMLVMFMQAGFALVETGLCRAKNAAHTMAMNFMIYPLGMLGFYVCGFAFMFGGASNVPTVGGPAVMDGVWAIGDGWNILGTKGFFLSGNYYDTSVFAIFFFQMVFMDTTATIPTGACAERWKFSAFMLYGLSVGTVMYPIYGGWVWGGGWCSQLGVKLHLGHGTCDFAGSSVVHLQGGIIAFWFAKLLGPRIGKYNRDGSPNPIPAHNVPMVMLGAFILAFGWFGFNPGGSLAGTDLRNAVSVVNTMLSSAAGALATTLWMWKVRSNKPDPTMMCSGMIAGLVAITGPCAFVTSFSAVVIGTVAGILVVESVFFVENKLKIDDPVGAISVHGVNGLWGVLAVGLFADGTYGDGYNYVSGRGVTGLFYHDAGQLAAQAIGAGACIVYLSVCCIIVFKVISALTGGSQRPSAQVEFEGLDIPEMGCLGYCGVVMDKASESPISR